MYKTIIATKPGNKLPFLEKRTADTIVAQIDCSSLLADNEVVFGNVQAEVSSSIIQIEEASTKLGKFIRFKVMGGPKTLLYEDYVVNFMTKTSSNSYISVPITIRVHSI